MVLLLGLAAVPATAMIFTFMVVALVKDMKPAGPTKHRRRRRHRR